MSDRPLMTLVLATRNQGKLNELRTLLAGLRVSVVAVTDVVPSMPVVEETGATFAENALLKARAVSRTTHLVTLADDSGLEVDALAGRPGVRSARFAREGATDAENNAELLSSLQEVEDSQRTARFRSVMALVDPFGEDDPILTEGTCEGSIARSTRGLGGFGYDPIFVVDEVGRTLAEIGDEAKNEISHRGKALRAMRSAIETLVHVRALQSEAILGGRP